MKVIDLAYAMAPDAKIEIIGIRPGEKIHEILLTEDEARHTKEYNDYFIIEPEHRFWNKHAGSGGKSLPEAFRYSSDINSHWLTSSDLKKIVADDEQAKSE